MDQKIVKIISTQHYLVLVQNTYQSYTKLGWYLKILHSEKGETRFSFLNIVAHDRYLWYLFYPSTSIYESECKGQNCIKLGYIFLFSLFCASPNFVGEIYVSTHCFCYDMLNSIFATVRALQLDWEDTSEKGHMCMI